MSVQPTPLCTSAQVSAGRGAKHVGQKTLKEFGLVGVLPEI